MTGEADDLIGGAWLAATYGISLVMPLAIVSRIGGRRATRVSEGATTETYVESMRPPPSLRGNLTFHLKHEVPHFELLSRLFAQRGPDDLAAWVDAEPTGQYARRAGFFYEFLTGRPVPIGVDVGGSYVDAVDPRKMVAASKGKELPNRRWRVRDNLPGNQAFCPVVRKT
ncbi:MAG TPA: cell filamentation protein Fic, partial [Ramlibacter sp.]|nr:cell filamentation protein Fic [Ramlibacter sp.]